jgi:hypothetical protein
MVERQKENILMNSHIESEGARNAQIESTMGLYETLQGWADVSLKDPDNDMYSIIIDEMSEQFRDIFKDPQQMLNIDKDDFYETLASTIRRKKVYASEYDIAVVKFILEKCTSPVFLNMMHTKEDLINTKNNKNAINVQRINENHYISWYEVTSGGASRKKRTRRFR